MCVCVCVCVCVCACVCERKIQRSGKYHEREKGRKNNQSSYRAKTMLYSQ